MKRLLREARVYGKLWRMLMLSSIEYRGWPLMFLQVLFVVVTDPLSTVLMFSRFGAVGEWTVERMILVYALSVASFGLAEVFCRGFDSFPWSMVRTGNFDRLLLRPCSLFTQAAASRFHLHRIVRPITCLAAVAWALRQMHVTLTPWDVLILLGALAGGFIMYSGVFILTSGLSFYTVKGLDWIYILTNASYQVTRVPQNYLPRVMRYAFTFLLPVLVISVYPASAVCGWGSPTWLGTLALPAGAAFFALSLVVWRIGVRHYTSTGS
ncbi:MAG: ABC-2 family transporter protein [Clostridiaceae bacterium]|nr:ABC-2 family transporter protein [Clostridiaceae bacterium]